LFHSGTYSSVDLLTYVCSDCVETPPSAEAQNDEVARRLWDVSVDLVNLKDSEIHPSLRLAA